MAHPSTSPPLTRTSVVAARELIRPYVHHTPVLTNATLTALANTPRENLASSSSVTSSATAAATATASPNGGVSEADGGDRRGRGSSSSSSRPARPKMRLWFKCENLQRVGAFKVRGAFHAIERLKREPGWMAGGGMERGVVTHSSGNHAQALSLAARTNGIPAYVVMPTISAPSKIAATKGYGADIMIFPLLSSSDPILNLTYRHFSGSTSVEREAVTMQVIEETGARLVPPYDHPDIILGQGTLGLELQEDVAAMMAADEQQSSSAEFGSVPGQQGAARQLKCSFAAPTTKQPKLPPPPSLETTRASGDSVDYHHTGETRQKENKEKKPGLDAILAPCGGGGMLSGVALSCEGTGIRVFGCEPSFQGADDGRRGYEAGARVETVKTLTIADGLRTPVGKIPWGVIYERRLVSGFFSVSEDEICDALRLVLERFKMIVEPSAAVPLAVALYNEDFRHLVEREAGDEGWDVGVVFSGGNVGLDALGKLFAPPAEGKGG